jgi:hypothetical protein
MFTFNFLLSTLLPARVLLWEPDFTGLGVYYIVVTSIMLVFTLVIAALLYDLYKRKKKKRKEK